ncbi:AMP-binding protein, partial [Streptomyces venezuelae]|uniref:AMP-binding protein n=1 Tax=Streptomyces venezuelae TaxID=54571 RepID=UPI00278C69DD
MTQVDDIRPLSAVLRAHALDRPDKVAFADEERHVTYARLAERTGRLAGHLAGHGLRRGDRVAILLGNSVTTVESYLAVTRAAAVGVPVNPQCSDAELAHQIDDSGARFVITDGPHLDQVERLRATRAGIRVVLARGHGVDAGPPHAPGTENTGSEGAPAADGLPARGGRFAPGGTFARDGVLAPGGPFAPDGVLAPGGLAAPDGVLAPGGPFASDGVLAPGGLSAPDGVPAPGGMSVADGVSAPGGPFAPDRVLAPRGPSAPDGVPTPGGMAAPDGVPAPDGTPTPDGAPTPSGVAAPDRVAVPDVPLSFEELAGTEPAQGPRDDLGLDEPAWILYTSGTTGAAKGVVSHQRACLWSVHSSYQGVLGLGPDDRLLWPLPLFHSLAHILCVLGVTVSGATARILPGFGARDVLDALRAEPCTMLLGVPSMYLRLVAAVEAVEEAGGSVPKPRLCVVTGAATGPELASAVERVLGAPLVNSYGATETCGAITLSRPDAERPPGTVGTAVPGSELRLVDPRTGRDAPTGDEGEVLVRSPGLLLRYHDRPEETAAALRDGWYRTGDLARRDAAGRLTITGRVKELVIRAGENIQPGEIEEVLRTVPGIADAAVTGRPDEAHGEVPVAYVVPAADGWSPAEALAACRERLSYFKVPAELYEIAALPVTGSGKVTRRALPGLPARLRALGTSHHERLWRTTWVRCPAADAAAERSGGARWAVIGTEVPAFAEAVRRRGGVTETFPDLAAARAAGPFDGHLLTAAAPDPDAPAETAAESPSRTAEDLPGTRTLLLTRAGVSTGPDDRPDPTASAVRARLLAQGGDGTVLVDLEADTPRPTGDLADGACAGATLQDAATWDVPGPEVPDPEAPGSGVQGPEVPGSGGSGSDVPGSDVPRSVVPGSLVPSPDVPGSGVSGPDVPGPDLQGPDAPGPDAPTPDVAAWLAVLSAPVGETEFALRAGEVLVPRLARVRAAGEVAPPFGGSGAVLVTGAGSGISRVLATHLVVNHGVHDLVLADAGEGGDPGAVAALAADLTGLGATVTVRTERPDTAEGAAALLGALGPDRPFSLVVHPVAAPADAEAAGRLLGLTGGSGGTTLVLCGRATPGDPAEAAAAAHAAAHTHGLTHATFLAFGPVAP